MPKLPRLTAKARLEKTIADAQTKLEQINQQEAEERRLKEKRFTALLGRAVNRELKSGDLLSEEIVYALLDKHIIRGVDRKFLSEAFDVPLETDTPKKNNIVSKSDVSKAAVQAEKNLSHEAEVTNESTPTIERKQAVSQTVSKSQQPPKRVLQPLPMPNSQDDLAQDFFLDEDFSDSKLAGERGL